MALMNFREYAAYAGISLSAVQSRIKTGAITPKALIDVGAKFPKIDSDIADADFAARHSPHHRMAGQVTKSKIEEVNLKTKIPEVPKPKIEKREIDGQEIDATILPTYPEDKFERYRDAKATTEELRARKLELEVAEEEGRLLDANEVRLQIAKEVSQVREALLNIAPKIAPILVSITDVVVMENTIIDEINTALEGLSRLTDAQ